jgi:hypothetical protein
VIPAVINVGVFDRPPNERLLLVKTFKALSTRVLQLAEYRA